MVCATCVGIRMCAQCAFVHMDICMYMHVRAYTCICMIRLVGVGKGEREGRWRVRFTCHLEPLVRLDSMRVELPGALGDVQLLLELALGPCLFGEL